MTVTTPTPTISRGLPAVSSTFDRAASVAAASAMALLAVVAIGLAVAFPIVLSLADAGRITLSAADLAATRSVAGVAWLFGIVALLHLAAAAATLAELAVVRRTGFVAAGVGAALAISSAIIVLRNGDSGAVDGAAMLSIAAAAYLFVLGVIAIGRRGA